MQTDSRSLTTVHLSTQRTWHGGEGQAALLMEGLRQRGHRVIVLARAGGQFAHRAASGGFEVHTRSAAAGGDPMPCGTSAGGCKLSRPT